MKGVILLSGGLDSATLALWMQSEGYELHGLTFDYGQRHTIEIARARELAFCHGISPHHVVRLPLDFFGGSALTDPNVPVPSGELSHESIPTTYVPARNLIFVSVAAAYAEAKNLDSVFIAANAVDYSGYPDCRPLFIERMNSVVEAATRRGVEHNPIRVLAPLINFSKAGIIKKADQLGLDFSMTTSCYQPDGEGRPCGVCDACLLRVRGFKEAGIRDPLKSPS